MLHRVTYYAGHLPFYQLIPGLISLVLRRLENGTLGNVWFFNQIYTALLFQKQGKGTRAGVRIVSKMFQKRVYHPLAGVHYQPQTSC